LAQAVPHSVEPFVQVIAHALPSQDATPVPVPAVGPGQLVPHSEPQLFGSLSRGHVEPGQACAFGLQVYPHVVPPLHVAVALAGGWHLPHDAPIPQLFGSLFAAQEAAPPLPQRWSFELHVNPQVPAPVHVGVPPVTAGHCVKHPPQWFGSAASLTHDAPQRLRPAPQPDVQANGSAVSPVGEQYGKPALVQAVEHPPQCAGALMSVSQPLAGFVEQIPYPGAQEALSNVQVLATHETLPATWGRFEQSWPQPPQL
jgi:hypothetical protein